MAGPEDLPPEYVGVELVLRGALLSVYNAQDRPGGRPVTLHSIDMRGIPEEARRSFEHELSVLQRLRTHPNIVTVHRVVTSPGSALTTLVMEPCQSSMADLVRDQGSLPVRQTIATGVKLAGALATFHRAGLVHREVKPSSIYMTRAGEPALADLGLAHLTASARLTLADQGIATSHVAPELLCGLGATPASDVYGLASCVYELVTGRGPFRSGTDESPVVTLRRILDEPVHPLLGPGIPPGLSDLLTSAMAKEPARRPPTAESMARELQELERASGWDVTPFLVFDPPVLAEPVQASRDAGGRAQVGDASATDLTGTEAGYDHRGTHLDPTDAPDPSATGAALEEATLVPDRAGIPERRSLHMTEPARARDPGEARDPKGAGKLRCAQGHEIEREDRPQRYCRYCGNALFMQCENGHRVAAGSRFCGACGRSVG